MVIISPYFNFQKEIITFVAKAETLQVYLRVKQKSASHIPSEIVWVG